MVPVGHFAVGMLPPFLITAALLPLKKRWLVYAPVVITLCGCWSLIPDIFVYYGRKMGRNELRWLMHDKLGDLFFLHRTLDRLGGEFYGDPPPPVSPSGAPIPQHPQHGGVWGLALVVFMYTCIILGYVVYIRRLLHAVKEKEALIRALSAARSPGPPP